MSGPSRELKRIQDVKSKTFSYETNCIRCGKEITLNWNGGELDNRVCCGLVYEVHAERYDFIVTDEGDE